MKKTKLMKGLIRKIKFTIQNVFESEDDFGSDEIGVNLLLNGELVMSYGDNYHDKGSYKAEGFIDGYCHAMNIEYNEDMCSTEEIVDKDFD